MSTILKDSNFNMSKVIIVGKAASGKDHIKERFRTRGFKCGVSHTTRPMRPGEIDGITYHYVDTATFMKMKANSEFYETANFNTWWYGTSKTEFDVKEVFLMTPAGIAQLSKEDRERSFILFLDIDSEVRKQRLSVRTMPGDSVERRIEADDYDFKDFTDFDAQLKNSDF